MLWIFLLQLINSVSGSPEAEQEILCTSNACFTLHMNKASFANAHQSCVDNGGNLMTVRGEEEEEVLRLLLSHIQGHLQDEALKFWIGLKLNRGSCVVPSKSLKGFKWLSGEEDSPYSNWGKEPHSTCTERCVRITYNVPEQNQLKWTDAACKSPAFYICKFYFKGMCKPLALLGPGEITYTEPFSVRPQKRDLKSFPVGTYANIVCTDQDPHYSVCTESEESTYRWTLPGPFCKSEQTNCTVNNGGCEHECRQEGDEVKCVCVEGYALDEDGLSCRIKDLCDAGTCEHKCVMAETGYSCRCPEGLKLDENLHNCTDVDECQSPVCGDHVCLNLHGSYTCECKEGYEVVSGQCSDVNECVRSTCQHSCMNTVGSFSCDCDEGFFLSQDDRSCLDIDECATNPCQFTCVNTAGSFSCVCQLGFHLESAGWTCAPDVTESSAVLLDADSAQESFTESVVSTTVEVQHLSPHTDPPLPDLVNVTQSGQEGNTSVTPSFAKTVDMRIIVCVLGSVIPLVALVAVTLAIAIYRCSRSKKEAKKNADSDGYCWVPSGLDPRLEKLYESILTDDL